MLNTASWGGREAGLVLKHPWGPPSTLKVLDVSALPGPWMVWSRAWSKAS